MAQMREKYLYVQVDNLKKVGGDIYGINGSVCGGGGNVVWQSWLAQRVSGWEKSSVVTATFQSGKWVSPDCHTI